MRPRPAGAEHSDGGNLGFFDAGGEASIDPWGTVAADGTHHPQVSVTDLQHELGQLLRRGLPATPTTAGMILPRLRSVAARSIHPYDPISRLASLNQLLVRVLVEMDDEEYGTAARILFAIARGTRGTTLTSRRQLAADTLAYEVTHFRKRIEPKILDEVATRLYQDLLRYKRRIRRAASAEEPTGDSPSLTSGDLSHEEELVSRIWQHVYGWRAELIAAGRLQAQPGYQSQAEDHRQAAVRQEQQLQELIAEYTQTYGQRLIQHGEAEYAIEAVERLVRTTEAD